MPIKEQINGSPEPLLSYIHDLEANADPTGTIRSLFVARESLEAVVRQRDELQDAIRRHRDERGDDRCFMDDEVLYASLPEGYTPPARDTAVELEHCKRFIACRQNPAIEYVSPMVEIRRLEARITELEGKLVHVRHEH